MGYSLWSRKESDMTEVSEHNTHTHTHIKQTTREQLTVICLEQGKKCRTNKKAQAFKTFAQSLLLKETKYSFQNSK